MFFANVPSVLDPTMRVGDPHVLSLEALYTPYALQGGWEQSTEPERWLERYATLVEPGFLDGVERWRAMTPDHLRAGVQPAPRPRRPASAAPLAALLGRPARAHPLRDAGEGPLPHRRGHLPGSRRVGRGGRNAATVILRS